MTQQSHCWAYTLRKPELRDTCTPIAALIITARTWKQPRCPSADEWIRKLWYLYRMEYYSAIKKNAFESVLMRWMKLEPIIQSEVSQKKNTNTQYINAYMCTLEKWQWWPYMRDNKRDTDVKNSLLTLWEKVKAGWFERIALKHVYYHINIISLK